MNYRDTRKKSQVSIHFIGYKKGFSHFSLEKSQMTSYTVIRWKMWNKMSFQTRPWTTKKKNFFFCFCPKHGIKQQEMTLLDPISYWVIPYSALSFISLTSQTPYEYIPQVSFHSPEKTCQSYNWWVLRVYIQIIINLQLV